MNKSPWLDFLDFSRKELFGVITLMSIVAICLVVINFHPLLFPKPQHDYSEVEKQFILAMEQEEGGGEVSTNAKSPSSAKSKMAEPFRFDPHTLDQTGYIALGFSEKQAASIRRYFDKGGKLRRPEDFKKLYVVNDYMYERLLGFIDLPQQESRPSGEYKARVDRPEAAASSPPAEERIEESRAQPLILDLNTASKEELMALKGIGPVYASRILKYKDILGGYADVAQLNEVYGLVDHPEIVTALEPHLQVSSGVTSKVNINTAEWKHLVRHPYIDKSVANSIIAMRETHGEYAEVEDLIQSHLIDQALLDKIAPYLTVGSR